MKAPNLYWSTYQCYMFWLRDEAWRRWVRSIQLQDGFGKTRKVGAAMEVGRTGRWTWNGYEKGTRWFELAAWLNGQRHLLTDWHGEKIKTCCYWSLVGHTPIHMKNYIWTTINKRSTSVGSNIKKKKKKKKK